IVATFMLGVLSSNAQPSITDTLQWLRTNIEQREHLFVHKPLQVLLDSLHELKNGIIQYSPPYPEKWSQPDTIWGKRISLYFGEVWGGGEIDQLHRLNPGINTHIPVIVVEFSWPVPYLSKWMSEDPEGLGTEDWNPQLEAFWSRYWINSVRIEEF